MIRESLPDLADPQLVDSVAAKAARATALLRNIARDYAPVVFANSLGAEDMVLTDLIWREEINIAIYSMDYTADTVARIIEETAARRITERGETRLDDQTSESSMEQRKKEGYC